MIKVVVADSDEVVRAGICSILRSSGSIKVVGDTGDGRQTMDLVRRHRPDVVVMDVQMAGVGGISTIRLVCREMPSPKVVVFTSLATEECAYRCFKAGASGFLIKRAQSREIVDATISVASGNSVISPLVARCLIDRFLQFDRDRARLARNRIEKLTPREQEVLAFVFQGLGNAEIARALYVSEGAIKGHVSHMLTKLQCVNRVQVALIAYDSDMFPSRVEVAPPLSGLQTWSGSDV